MACLFSFPLSLSLSLSHSLFCLHALNSILLFPSSISSLAVQPAQFNNELSLLSFSFPSLPACLITPPNASSHSLSPSLCFISPNSGPWMALAWTLSSSSLFILALRVIQLSSVSYLLLPPPLSSSFLLHSPFSILCSLFPFLSSSLDNFVRLVVMLLSF